MTTCGELRAGAPGQVQLPQHTQSYSGSRHFQPDQLLLRSSSSASHLNSPRTGFTRKVNDFLPLQEMLKQFVMDVTGEAGALLPAYGQQKSPHILTVFTVHQLFR